MGSAVRTWGSPRLTHRLRARRARGNRLAPRGDMKTTTLGVERQPEKPRRAPRDPNRPAAPVSEPPPAPRNQPDGAGEPDEIEPPDEDIKSPVEEPDRDPSD